MSRHHMNAAALALALIVSLISSVQPSLAIGISPGRLEMDFSPGRNSTYNIYVIGGSYENVWVKSRHYEKCSLAQYIIPEHTELMLGSGERYYMRLDILLPMDYPRPGLHECEVVAEEVPLQGYSGVAAFSAAAMQIWIRVPYPAKYLDGELSVPNVNLSGTATFTIYLESMGLENVTASGVITVTDSNGRTVATLQTGSVPVRSMERGTLQATWDATGMQAGRYYAKALVEYGAEKPLPVESGFKIGDVLVKVVNITYPSDIFPDQIVKLEVLVDSYWNDRIEGSYVTLDVTKGGPQVGETRRSESFDLEPWASRTVPLYWDTAGLTEGAYVAEVSVHYSGKVERGIAALEIKQRQNPYLLLLIIIAVAAAAAVAAYVYRRKKGKGGVKKKDERKGADDEANTDRSEGAGKEGRGRGKGAPASGGSEKKTGE